MKFQNTTMEEKNNIQDDHALLWAANETNVGNLAASIAGNYKSNPKRPITIQYIGAGACNQAIKSVLLANKFISEMGKVIHIIPASLKLPDGIVAFQLKLLIKDIN